MRKQCETWRTLAEESLAEIQGNIHPGLTKPTQAFIFVRFSDNDHLRTFVRRVRAQITSSKMCCKFKETYRGFYEKAPPVLWMNIAFSFRGLSKLTHEAARMQDDAFRAGMGVRERMASNMHHFASKPENEWTVGGRSSIADLVVILAHDEMAGIKKGLSALMKTLPSQGTVVHLDVGDRLHPQLGSREHFGYRDGISQPLLRGFDTDDCSDSGDSSAGRWVWPGEFIFGFPESHQTDPDVPGKIADGGLPWMRNGSFLVFQRLSQDVASFQKLTAAIAADLQKSRFGASTINAAWVGSRLMGRWRNGLPIANFPDLETDPVDIEAEVVRDLDYRTQPGRPSEERCPYFSHIRKVNPRDDRFRIHRHRILRRGIPFGRPYPHTDEKGLLFACYQTDIPRQFEFIRHVWARGDDTGHLPGTDMIIGNMPTKARLIFRSGSRTKEIDISGLLSRPLVTLTGGDYFFSPSIKMLEMV